MPYNSEETIAPFWAEYSAEASGRDPLAIQNSSVVIYTKMIIGITNVTNRIRYNGFYCWIFDTIAQNINKKNSLSEQTRYSRRAELLLAYIMVKCFPETTGVSGSSYAANNMESLISLINGADWESKKETGSGLYWKFKLGVFGQYYSGVVRDLNLINHPNEQAELNIYTLTASGKALGMAFAQNIPKQEISLFWECVFNGFVQEEDLAKLKSFALHIIPEESEERLFYRKTLLAADNRKTESNFNRRNTIHLLLKHISEQDAGTNNPALSFLRNNYMSHFKLKELPYSTGTAWYLFEINELLHVAFEHFHFCFLYSIEEYPTALENCINELIKISKQSFQEDEIDSENVTIGAYIEALTKQNFDIYEYYDAMEQSFNYSEFGECVKYAVNTILSIYINSKAHFEVLESFATSPYNNFNRDGYAIKLISDLVESKLDMTIDNYLKSILLYAINLHTFSSYGKTKIGQNLVHNYMIEEHNVWRLRETIPNRTSPRLQNVIQYSVDIGWLRKEGKTISITDSGKQIIDNV